MASPSHKNVVIINILHAASDLNEFFAQFLFRLDLNAVSYKS